MSHKFSVRVSALALTFLDGWVKLSLSLSVGSQCEEWYVDVG